MENEVPSLVESLAMRSLFVGLSNTQILAVVDAGRIESFGPAQTILREGEPGQALYTVLSGSITIHATRPGTGTQAEVAVLHGGEDLSSQYEGDFFGEMSVLDFEPISATVTAREPCELLIVPVQALYNVFQNDRDIQLILISNIARTLSRRLRLANRHHEMPQTAGSS